VLSILIGGPAAMAQSNENYIEYRQKVMGSIGQNSGAIGDIMKNKLPLTGNIADHARVISINAKLIASAFKQNASEGKTDAKAEVWKEWSKFEENAKKLETASAKLADVAGTGDMAAVGEAVKGVGGACKGCHDDFRKPKEQSYKTMK
jgi:cytochrome c556